MNQRTMFGDDGGTSQYGEYLSRRTDPETSKLAEGSVSSKIDGLRLEFVNRLRNLPGPSTAFEIASGDESIRKRAKECVDRGLVRVAGRRLCRLNGTMCQVYELTEAREKL